MGEVCLGSVHVTYGFPLGTPLDTPLGLGGKAPGNRGSTPGWKVKIPG